VPRRSVRIGRGRCAPVVTSANDSEIENQFQSHENRALIRWQHRRRAPRWPPGRTRALDPDSLFVRRVYIENTGNDEHTKTSGVAAHQWRGPRRELSQRPARSGVRDAMHSQRPISSIRRSHETFHAAVESITFREGGLGAAPGEATFTGSPARAAGRLAATGATGPRRMLRGRSTARSMARCDPFGIRCSSRSRQSSAETGSALRVQAITPHLGHLGLSCGRLPLWSSHTSHAWQCESGRYLVSMDPATSDIASRVPRTPWSPGLQTLVAGALEEGIHGIAVRIAHEGRPIRDTRRCWLRNAAIRHIRGRK